MGWDRMDSEGKETGEGMERIGALDIAHFLILIKLDVIRGNGYTMID